MRHIAIKRRADDAERGIGVEHQAERGEFGAAARNQEIGQRRRQRSNSSAERADQAVTREHLGAALIGGAVRQHRMLERHQHAEITAGWIDGADEGDQRNQHKMLDAGKGDAGGGHQARARDQQRPQVVTGRDPADDQGQQRGSQQRCGRDDADRDRVVTERGHVGRQNDDSKTVAEATQTPCDIKQPDQRVGGGGFWFSRDIGHPSVHAPSSTRREVRRAWTADRLTGSLLRPR